MFKKTSLKSFLISTLVFGSVASHAVDQCYLPNGTTVTSSGACGSTALWDGVNMIGTFGGACTLTFSPAISGSGLYLAVGATDSSDTVAVEINGTPYSVTSAEIDNTTTPPTRATGNLIETSGLIGMSGPSGSYANGRVNFLSAPTSVTSMKMTNVGWSYWSVCSGTPPAPVTPAAIPTLGEWAMIFMASLMAMFGIRRMRRSK